MTSTIKLNLLLNNPDDFRNGYVNIDPFSNDDKRIKADVSDLSHTYDDGEVDEIIAHGILDYFPIGDANNILNGWLAKLARGGRLTVSTVDTREVARLFLMDMLSIEELNAAIHGEQREPWETRKTSFTLNQFVEVLQNRGFRILSARIDQYNCVVTCERP